jgi:hypothetical protein
MGQIVKLHGYEAEITDRYATIADVQVWSETHVGSRTHFSPNAIPSTSVYSNIANKSRVFIAFDDGEEEVREVNDQYPMRPGHRVLYRFLTFQGETKRVFFRNLNTGNTWHADKIIEVPRVRFRRIFPTRVFVWTAAIVFLSLAGLLGYMFLTLDAPPGPNTNWGLIFSLAFGIPVLAGFVLASLAMMFRLPTEEERNAQWKANRFEAAVVDASMA